MKRSAGGLLARGEQLCEAGCRPVTTTARHQRATDEAGRRPETKVVAGGLLANGEQPDGALSPSANSLARCWRAISEQPDEACLLSAGSSLVIAGSGSLTAGSHLARACTPVSELELELK